MKIVVVLALVCGVAHADRWSRLADRSQGGSWLHYELSVVHDVDDRGTQPVIRELVLAGARLHGFVGENPTVNYHVGLDLAAGSTLRGAGFAYDVALFPLGVGLRVGETGVIALGAGVGAMGAVGTLDDAVTFPVELNAELGRGVRVLARVRTAWVAGAPGRHDGSPSAPFADELDATLALRLGHHYSDYGYPSGNGYFIGASYRELAGARFLGGVIGHSIDLATPRQRRR